MQWQVVLPTFASEFDGQGEQGMLPVALKYPASQRPNIDFIFKYTNDNEDLYQHISVLIIKSSNLQLHPLGPTMERL